MGKGRRKIEIEKIEDRQRRNVTFTKRRQGLFKKAEDLSRLTGAQISLIVFSPGGNPFTYSSSPSNDLFNHKFGAKEDEEVAAGDDGYWWDNLNVEGLDTIEKLTAVKNQLIEVKEKIAKRKQELLAKSISTGTPDTTTTTSADVSMDDDLEMLLTEAYETTENWLPPPDDSTKLFDGLDAFEKLPALADLELDMDH